MHKDPFWTKRVVDPLVQQLGDYKKVKIQDPFVIGKGQEISMIGSNHLIPGL